MCDVLRMRGGHQILLKVNKTALSSAKSFEFEIHPYRSQITYNSKIVIDNLFHEHNTRRYVQALMGKIRNVTSYTFPSTEVTQVNISISVGGTFCAIGLVTITILTAFYLFQYAERKRYQSKNNRVITHVNC